MDADTRARLRAAAEAAQADALSIDNRRWHYAADPWAFQSEVDFVRAASPAAVLALLDALAAAEAERDALKVDAQHLYNTLYTYVKDERDQGMLGLMSKEYPELAKAAHVGRRARS